MTISIIIININININIIITHFKMDYIVKCLLSF